MNTAPDRAAVAVLVLVVVLPLALAPAGAAISLEGASATSAEGPSATSADESALAAEELPEADTTVTRIEIAENGTARWSVAVRTRLANESDVDDYEAFQERFRADRETYVDQFERRMTGVVSSASESTGRNMTASGFRAETSIQEIPRRWGVVTYSFRWTNFAAGDGDAVVVGDVFEGGLYLDEDDRLEIDPPEGYTVTETSPPPDETEGTTVVWSGPEEFADHQPTVRFEPTDSATASETAESGRMSGPALLVGAAAVLAVAGIALAVVSDREPVRRLRSRLPIPLPIGTDAAAEPPGDGPPDESGASDAEERDRTAPADEPESALDPDLLTDEDRVRRLLERNGGRMRQAAIADELEWSASKTSRVVSGMVDDGAVEKLRIGRENVIDLLEESDRDGANDASTDG